MKSILLVAEHVVTVVARAMDRTSSDNIIVEIIVRQHYNDNIECVWST